MKSNNYRPVNLCSSQSQHQNHGGLPTVELSVCMAIVVRSRVVPAPENDDNYNSTVVS